MNCGRSSSVEWKLPKLQRRVRFPSPAPARPAARRAVLLCPLRARGLLNAAGPGTKLALHTRFDGPPGTKLAQLELHGATSGTKLTLHAQNLPIWRILSMQGEFYPVFITNKPHRANFLPHTPSATTGTTETTPQHNTRNHAMKYYSPTLHTQHHTMKHLPPQHAKNNQNSPIFTMQGRTFFHNTHHTPTPGRHFFQPTPLPAKETQTRPSSFSIVSPLPGQTARTSAMVPRSQHDEAMH